MKYFIIFLFFLVAALFGCLYFVHTSFIHFFYIQSLMARRLIAGTLFFLTINFIIAMIHLHLRYNIFGKYYYLVTSVWIGIFVYLLIFFTGGRLLELLTKFFINWNVVNLGIFGAIIVLVSLFSSIYGTINARNIATREMNIKIKNLPIAWHGKKIVQISDLHLGAINGQKFLEDVVARINNAKPDIVFITGDLFDGRFGDLYTLAEPIKKINSKMGIYFITGNHESYMAAEANKSEVENIINKLGIHFLHDEIIEKDGMQIAGVNYRMPGQDKIIGSFLDKLKKDEPSIFLIHEPIYISEAKKYGVSLQLSGHTHRGQLWPFGYISDLIYRGYDYGLYQEGDYSLYTTSGTGTWGPPMRTGSRSEIVAIILENK